MQTLTEGESKRGHIKDLTVFATFPQVLNCSKIKNRFLFIKKKIEAGWWWRMPIKPILGRQRQAEL